MYSIYTNTYFKTLMYYSSVNRNVFQKGYMHNIIFILTNLGFTLKHIWNWTGHDYDNIVEEMYILNYIDI